MNLQQAVTSILTRLKDFAGYIEISNFVDFVYFNMSSDGGPEGVMGMLGMGASKEMSLNFDPERKIFFSRVLSGPQDANAITVFTRDNPIANKIGELSEKFHVDCKDKILDTVFPAKLHEALKSQKNHVTFVQSSDATLLNDPKPQKISLRVETLYHNILSYISGFSQAKSIFSVEGSGSEPDILFSFNFSIFPQAEQQVNYQLEVFLDPAHLTRGKRFIRVDTETFKVDYLENVDEIRMNYQYTLILHVKAFKKP